MSATVRNILAVARREFTVRARTRSFLLGTVVLAVAGAALALAPVGIRWIQGETAATIGVVDQAHPALSFDPVARLDVLLNASTPQGEKSVAVVATADEATARAEVEDGKLSAALVIDRSPGPDLSFVIISKELAGRRTPELLQQAAFSLAIADRLDRLGVAPGDQATLFAPPHVAIEPPKPAAPGAPTTGTELAATALVGQVLIVFLLLAVVLYGQWVAMSVAEEKGSRVMELMLSAASPRQMLAGKVAGTGAAGMTQYAGILAAGLLGIALQGPITALILPGASSGGLPLAGLTPAVLVMFVVFFALGFTLYSLIYAAAGSVVSRQEEVQQVITPLTFVTMGGYLAAIFAGSAGSASPWVVFLSLFPFTSPYVMLVRLVDGTVQPWEPLLAVAILVPTIGAMLILASRVYSAGVLLYGQRPSFRTILEAMRIRG